MGRAGSGELPAPTEGWPRKEKGAANKHLNAGSQILWLMQKTLMKNEVNVGNAITAPARDARLYN